MATPTTAAPPRVVISADLARRMLLTAGWQPDGDEQHDRWHPPPEVVVYPPRRLCRFDEAAAAQQTRATSWPQSAAYCVGCRRWWAPGPDPIRRLLDVHLGASICPACAPGTRPPQPPVTGR